MTTFIEDSPRNLVGWMKEAFAAGDATEMVLNPWVSPYPPTTGNSKPGIARRSAELRDAGIPYWFDPTTHALQMIGVGRFAYYDNWDLWGGPRGDLTTSTNRVEHVRRVFAIQDEISAPHLAPTLLLTTPLSIVSTLALELARDAIEADPTTWLTIAGSSTFWSGGVDLDAHIGALAALRPAGWFVSFVQPDNDLPPAIAEDEIFGVLRSVRALAEYVPVHVSHGDLAGLPAIAAGATSVGTGWSKRQRVVAMSDYEAPTDGQGRWYKRPTLLGLLGTLDTREGARLNTRAPALATSLGGLPVPAPKPVYLHHVAQLNAAAGRIQGVGAGYEDRARELDRMYSEASTNWAALRVATGIRDSSDLWVNPLQQGLRMYALSEGWSL